MSTALFAMIADQHVFIVAKDEGIQDVGVTVRLGHRFPITWGAIGKSIVSFLSDSDRESILSGERLYFHGHPSRLDRDRLEQELDDCRRSGLAVEPGDMGAGINAVGSPASGPGGKLLGAIVVIGTFPEDAVEQYGGKVAKAQGSFRNQSVGRVHTDPQPRQPKRTYTWIRRRRAMWDASLRSARYFRRGDTFFMTLFLQGDDNGQRR
jgi:DNA-binding IclR family transcriptional regulator